MFVLVVFGVWCGVCGRYCVGYLCCFRLLVCGLFGLFVLDCVVIRS